MLANIPNLLSGFRLLAAPFLLYLAWIGQANLFLILFALSLTSDVFDGFVARRFHKTSELGSRLDSWGDLAVYSTLPICAWWLWRDILVREAFFVLLAFVAYVVPIAAGYLKFHRLTSYHTWAAKAAAVIMNAAVLMLLLLDVSWPFKFAALWQVLVACEEVAITLLLAKLQSNVRSYWHLL